DDMGETTHRGTQGAPGVREAAAHGDQATADLTPAPAATYWRRRLVVLAVGLTTLAVAAWSLSESLKVHAGAHSSAASRDGPREQGPAAPAGGTPGAAPHAGASLHPSASDAATAGATFPVGHSPYSAPAYRPAPEPSAPASGFGGFKPAFCSWHSIVLSL